MFFFSIDIFCSVWYVLVHWVTGTNQLVATYNFVMLVEATFHGNILILFASVRTVDLGNFVPLFNFSMCSTSGIYPKR